MFTPFDWLLILFLITNLMVLGSSRFKYLIKALAIQGSSLGYYTLILYYYTRNLHFLIVGVLIVGIKGIAFPTLLLRTIKRHSHDFEISPLISYAKSLSFGVIALLFSLWLSSRLPFYSEHASIALPISFFTIFVGIFIIVFRKKAITQGVGYIVFENGINLLTIELVGDIPLLVEFGVLLDAFVAVLIINLAINNISRHFNHININKLRSLRG